MVSLWRRSHPLVRALVVGGVVAVAHLLVEACTWIEWEQIPRPGELPHMPALWPVISFPIFTVYEWLTGDRAMFSSFWWVMLGNSAVWGFAAGIAYRMRSSPRPPAQVREAA